jgi:HPt (histidine-containing phosphotransfer) domain-containing protein
LSVADRDTASIRSTTHIAVSVTGAIGAQKAQSLAESLNALAHTNSIEGLDEGIADLDMALAETMTALDSFLEAS